MKLAKLAPGALLLAACICLPGRASAAEPAGPATLLSPASCFLSAAPAFSPVAPSLQGAISMPLMCAAGCSAADCAGHEVNAPCGTSGNTCQRTVACPGTSLPTCQCV